MLPQASSPSQVVGRLAPSPTGRLHAGNIFAALLSWLVAKSCGGKVVLRIEDLDPDRSKQAYIDAVQRDFAALGLTWDAGPYFQHDREEAYRAAYERIASRGLVYPCFCTRADLHVLAAPHRGEKAVYPGTCRNLTEDERRERAAVLRNSTSDPRREPAMRLTVDDRVIVVDDIFQGTYRQKLDEDCGDFIVRRSDGAFAYQLAVVVDDAEQGVNSVVRGIDLLSSTPQQMYLQDLLGLAHPTYGHIPLFVAEDGRRLAKRNHDAAIDALLAQYKTPQGVIGHVAFVGGIRAVDEPITPEDLLDAVDISDLAQRYRGQISIPYPTQDAQNARPEEHAG